MKQCSMCKEFKEESQFSKNTNHIGGLCRLCKPCNKTYQIIRRYDISEKEWNELYVVQEGKCAICKTNEICLSSKLGVDHNKITKKVRGLLCVACNTSLGKLKADIGIGLLKQAIYYLENPPFNKIRPPL